MKTDHDLLNNRFSRCLIKLAINSPLPGWIVVPGLWITSFLIYLTLGFAAAVAILYVGCAVGFGEVASATSTAMILLAIIYSAREASNVHRALRYALKNPGSLTSHE